jgi:acetate kinase
MSKAILVLNAGSSSIKFALYARDGSDLALRFKGNLDGIGTRPHLSVTNATGDKLVDDEIPQDQGRDHHGAILSLRGFLHQRFGDATLAAVGHRVVHGGEHYSTPVVIDDSVIGVLESLVPLAPLHQPHHLSAIRAVAEAVPGVPQVACFDTAFHRSQPPVAQAFALPRELSDEGVRRYGFHGLSYEYIAATLPSVAPALTRGKVVVAHLGNGASLCAMQGGKSVATTMGLTPLDGLMMGTRSGSLDPGVVLYLMQHKGMDANSIETLLYSQSGLLGVSGISSDMRTLLESDDSRAQQAIDLFVYRAVRELGSLAAALGGIDGIVFTAGIGENAAPIRERICRMSGWLGVELDEPANRAGGPLISKAGASVSAWVIPTDENLMIARHTAKLLRL